MRRWSPASLRRSAQATRDGRRERRRAPPANRSVARSPPWEENAPSITPSVVAMPALAALLLITVTAASFEAKVIGVVDAETLDILDESKTTRRIRIHSLECSQPLAKKARSAMSALDAGQRVAVENLGDDRYGRVIAGIWT